MGKVFLPFKLPVDTRFVSTAPEISRGTLHPTERAWWGAHCTRKLSIPEIYSLVKLAHSLIKNVTEAARFPQLIMLLEPPTLAPGEYLSEGES